MKKIYLLFLVACIHLNIFAYDFTVDGIYYNITSPTNLTVEVTYATSSYNSYSGNVSIPSHVTDNTITYSVTSIGDNAFSKCSGLTSVTIPNSVTSIGSNSFKNCSGLTSVILPSSITSIGSYVFYYCAGLTSISIPTSLVSIGTHAFSFCTALSSINVTSANTAYTSEDGVLFNKDKTTLICCPANKAGTYSIPSSVTSIGYVAFYYCKGLTAVDIPPSVTSIGRYAFLGCSGLQSITIPGSVSDIGLNAFLYCDALTSINVDPLNTKYSSIDGILFNIDKTYLICYPSSKPGTSYSVPATVTSFESYAFAYCVGLTSVTIPSSVTSISDHAFFYCTGLTSINIPSSITSFGGNDFFYCSKLTSITIPSSVTSFGFGTFAHCTSLNSIYLCHTTPPVLSSSDLVFYNIGLTCTLYVPAGTESLYQTATTWKDFSTIGGFNPTAISTIPEGKKIRIYPNPVKADFSIYGFEGTAIIEVYNIQGQLAFSREINTNQAVASESLKRGIYVVKVKTSSGEIVKKIIKQ